MSFPSEQSLTEQCFQVSPSDGARDEYEKLAEQKIKLKRKLKELEAEGKGNSQAWKDARRELNQIESRLQ